MTSEQLAEILRLHGMWLRDEEGGKRANLYGAPLGEENLIGVDLTRANLANADLEGAYLIRANLTGANLDYADLVDADLTDATLTDATFTGARLLKVNLTGANLRAANLAEIKDNMIAAIIHLPYQIPFLRQSLLDGKINGATFYELRECLAGTMARACDMDWQEFRRKEPMPINPWSPRERWFLAINEGDTPATNQVAAITLEWIDEALATVSAERS